MSFDKSGALPPDADEIDAARKGKELPPPPGPRHCIAQPRTPYTPRTQSPILHDPAVPFTVMPFSVDKPLKPYHGLIAPPVGVDEEMVIPNDPVKRPNHYARYKVEPVFFIMENELPFWMGNVIKYVMRHDEKGGVQDLRKAVRYLEMEIGRLDGNPGYSL